MSIIKVKENTYALRDNLFKMVVAVGTLRDMVILKQAIECK